MLLSMNERLLQFIWQFQYFNKNNLETAAGVPLTILHPGQLNHNQGPDFSAAKIKLDTTTWAGNIEIHINASDWFSHNHTNDANYTGIILHVVWNNDSMIADVNHQPIATLELQPLVSKMMLQHYEQLMHAGSFVPCENFLPVLNDVGWLSWKERLLAERLQRKAEIVHHHLQQVNNHWEEAFWRLLARNFGMKVNAGVFEQVAMSISIQTLAKHKHQLHQIEALLMGQAALLSSGFTEDYPKLLQREYRFLAKKYGLQPVNRTPDFLRMRPANFPTVRLAQLAVLIQQSSHLFSKILELEKVDAVYNLLDVTANDYWHYHYLFDEATPYKPKKLGKVMTDNIIINTVVPVLFAYGRFHKNEVLKERAVQLLAALPPEQNAVTKAWQLHGVKNQNAADAQALIELKTTYCNQRNCLQCAVGNKLLKNG